MIPNLTTYKILFTPLFACLFMINLSAQTDILTEAEEMPYFSGCNEVDISEKRDCSNKNLVRFIANNLIYPNTAKEQEIEGTVYVAFVVNEQGKVTTPNIIRDIGGGCGEAALDVLRNMPTWKPGIHQGKNVKVKLNLPIHFSLKDNQVIAKGQKYQINWGSLATQINITKQELEDQLKRTLHVRDPYGDEKPITELIFAYEKKRSYIEGSSAGKINNELKKVISKCKKGGFFTITAVIQVNGELIYVKQTFRVS